MKVRNIILFVISLLSFLGFIILTILKSTFNATQLLMLSIFIILPIFFENIIKYKISDVMHYIYAFFLLLHFIFGEVFMFSVNFKIFDSLLHYFTAIIICILGYGLINYFIKDKYFVMKVIFAFMFAMCLEYVWEILEYSIDEIFLTNMQRYVKNNMILVGHNALKDTIKDMYIAIMGCVTFLLFVNLKVIKNIKLIDKK